MATYDQDTMLNFAVSKYSECKSLIEEMSDILKQVEPKFSFEIAMKQFDMVLQAVLMMAAAEDGAIAAVEAALMSALTEYGDVLELVNTECRKDDPSWLDIGWEHLDALTPENKKKLAVIAGHKVDKYAAEFVQFFALVDKVYEKDYMELLKRAVGGIILALAGADGDDLDSKTAEAESLQGLAMYDLLICKKWEQALAEG